MPNPRVLVIDDDPMITQLLKEHLSEEGYEVSTVHLAEQGFQSALKSPPDLIFLDVMLPDATGFQTVARFRKEAITSTIPIIMMSGTARNANQLEIAKGMGATDYVLKPFDVIQVGERVGQLVKNKPVKKPFSPPTPAPVPEPVVETIPEPELEPGFTPIPPPMTMPQQPPLQEYNPPKKIELISMLEVPPRKDPPAEPKPKAEVEAAPWTLPDRPSVENTQPAPMAEPKASPIEFQNEILTEPTPIFSLPSFSPYQDQPATSSVRSFGWIIAPLLFIAHIAMTIFSSEKDPMMDASYAAGSWALLLGCMVAVSGVLQISMTAQDALKIEGWAAIPIVLRGLSIMAKFILPLPTLPAGALWMRPLDLFEIAAILILALSLRKLPGGSLIKSFLAAILIALGWCLSARGFFHPF